MYETRVCKVRSRIDLKAVLSGDEEFFRYGSGGILPNQICSGTTGTGDAAYNPRKEYRDAPTDLDMRRAHTGSLEGLEVLDVVTTVKVDETNRIGWTTRMRPGASHGQLVITRAGHVLQNAFLKVPYLGVDCYPLSRINMSWIGCTKGE